MFNRKYVFIHGGFSSLSCYLSGCTFLNDLYLENHPTLEIGCFGAICHRRDGDLLVVSQTTISPQVNKSYTKMRIGNGTKSTKIRTGTSKRIPFKTCVQIRKVTLRTQWKKWSLAKLLPKKKRKKDESFLPFKSPKKNLAKKKNNGTSKPEFVIEIGRAHKCSQLNPYALP